VGRTSVTPCGETRRCRSRLRTRPRNPDRETNPWRWRTTMIHLQFIVTKRATNTR
jgi:hypothetical protein